MAKYGLQAGFVPYLGKYSKVGHDQGKPNDGTAANDDGLKHKFAAKVVVTLSMDELKIQNSLPCEVPPRLAVHAMEPVPDSEDYYGDVCTLETMPEFRQYATLLNMAGYYVPKNWTWGMSIRDRFR